MAVYGPAPGKTLSDGQDTSLNTGGVLYTDRRIFYPNPQTYAELWTSVTPFSSMLMTSGQTLNNLPDPVFKLFEHRNPWQKQEMAISTATTIANSDTPSAAVTVTSTTGLPSTVDTSFEGLTFEVWDSTKTTKRGSVVLTDSNSGSPKFKTLQAAALTTVSGDILVLVTHASGEGVVAPDAFSDDLVVVWGETQITRVAVEVTGTLYRAALRGYSKELERLRKQKMEQHKMFSEKKLLRGSSVLGMNLTQGDTFSDIARTNKDTTAKKIRTTMGLIPALEKYGDSTDTDEYQNVFKRTSGYTWSQWIDDCEKIWQYLPENGIKDFYCGPRALSFWSKVDANSATRTKFQVRLSDMRSDMLGINFKYLETPFGVSRLIYTPALKREYTNLMLSVTPENLFRAEYAPLSYKTNIKVDNAYDGVKDEIYCDDGLGLTLIESHSMISVPLS